MALEICYFMIFCTKKVSGRSVDYLTRQYLSACQRWAQAKGETLSILQFFNLQFENSGQAVENVNGVYGSDTGTVNRAPFWLGRFRLGNFDHGVDGQLSRMSIK